MTFAMPIGRTVIGRTVRPVLSLAAVSAFLILLGACGGGADVLGPLTPVGGTPPGGTPGTPPAAVATGALKCAQPGGTYTLCDLTLSNSGGFTIDLLSDSCVAHGNTVVLTKPVVDTLFVDGCYQPAPKSWSFPGPFAAGTAISFEVRSPALSYPPGMHATGGYPVWDLMVEDGGNQNFRDLLLKVTATP